MQITKEFRDLDQILEEGINCEVEVTIGEVVECLMCMMKTLPDTDIMQNMLQNLDPKYHENVENFLISVFGSQIATLTENFKSRERFTGKC